DRLHSHSYRQCIHDDAVNRPGAGFPFVSSRRAKSSSPPAKKRFQWSSITPREEFWDVVRRLYPVPNADFSDQRTWNSNSPVENLCRGLSFLGRRAHAILTAALPTLMSCTFHPLLTWFPRAKGSGGARHSPAPASDDVNRCSSGFFACNDGSILALR